MSKVTRLLYSASTLAGDKERKEECAQIIAKLEKLEKDIAKIDIADEPDEKARQAFVTQRARLVERAKDLYQDIMGFPMRLGD